MLIEKFGIPQSMIVPIFIPLRDMTHPALSSELVLAGAASCTDLVVRPKDGFPPCFIIEVGLIY